ncbi:MAG: VWA domain-containing protein [Rhodobacteraceae bacterium]|nr:VWA domain-containing protein [Paracoccaceae bacterium]
MFRNKKLSTVRWFFTWLFVAYLPASVGLAQGFDGLVRSETPTIVVFDQEGRPGKWALTPAPKVKTVQRILDAFSEVLAGRADVSLRRASVGTSGDPNVDCKMATVDYPLGARLGRAEISAFAGSFVADGHQVAPSAALQNAVDDLRAVGGGRVIYFTDGISSCRDDPLWIAERSGPNVAIDIVAIGKAEQLHSLAELALASGGDFYLITSPEDLFKLGGPMINDVLPEGGSFGEINVGETPPGELPPLAGEGGETVSTNPSGPLFSGGNSGEGLGRIDTGIKSCPAFDLLSRNLLDYSKGIDPVDTLPVPDPVALAFILDASGSMAARQAGRAKMSIAKEALAAAVTRIDGANVITSLWAYGFDTRLAKTAEASCPNTQEIVPFARNQSRRVARAANALTAYGYTPLATSLSAVGESLQSVRASRRIVVLISDGEETCGGDPIAAAARLTRAGVAVSTYVVGYDLDAEQRKQLEAVAEAGGTEYLDAADKNALAEALKEIVEFAVEKTVRIAPSCENPVQGGLTPEAATLLLPGIYTLGELLEPGTYRYYRVATEEGQRGIVRGLIQSQQYVTGDDGPRESASAPTAMTIDMLYPDGRPTAAQSARGAGIPGTAFDATFVDTQGIGFIFGIGDNYRLMSPDALFEVSVVPFADGVGGDAGGDPKGNDFSTISRDGQAAGHIGNEDLGDLWRYEVDASSDLTIAVEFENPDFRYRLSVFDEASGKRLGRSTKGMIRVSANAAIRLLIENRTPKTRPLFSAYTIDVQHE